MNMYSFRETCLSLFYATALKCLVDMIIFTNLYLLLITTNVWNEHKSLTILNRKHCARKQNVLHILYTDNWKSLPRTKIAHDLQVTTTSSQATREIHKYTGYLPFFEYVNETKFLCIHD